MQVCLHAPSWRRLNMLTSDGHYMRAYLSLYCSDQMCNARTLLTYLVLPCTTSLLKIGEYGDQTTRYFLVANKSPVSVSLTSLQPLIPLTIPFS